MFDVFQLAFVKSCGNTKQRLKSTADSADTSSSSADFLGDFIIIFQKLSQQEPQGVLACLNPMTLKLLNEIVAMNGSLTSSPGQLQTSQKQKMEQQFIVSNIKSILRNIDSNN